MDQAKREYQIQGLSCASCALRIENSLQSNAFLDAKVDFITQTLTISSDDIERLSKIVREVEPNAKLFPVKKNQQTKAFLRREEYFQILQIIISLIFLIIGIILQGVNDPNFQTLSYFSLIIGYILAGWKVILTALKQIRKFDLTNEHFLMSVATVGAIVINQIPEAVAVMIFYSIGIFLQQRAVNHARNAVQALLDIKPDQANLVSEGTIKVVPVEDVKIGDTILVKPGEKVPLDGIVIQGNTTLNMIMLTGESQPVLITPGMVILSGSIPSGSIRVQVRSLFYESTISRILDAVENATTKKSTRELFITRFARYYTPFVLLIAILIAIIPPILFQEPFNIWIYRALVVLVISCPCALVVSIPLVYFSGIGRSSKRGILMKGASVIDSLNDISAVYWDKTGTLTEGIFEVITIIPGEGYSPQEVLKWAALAETYSNHPIAESIRRAYGKSLDLELIKEYEEISALGVRVSTVNGDEIIIGNDKMIHQVDCAHPKCILDQTVIYVVRNGIYLGYIIIGDQLREKSIVAIDALRKQGVRKIGILTGDTKNVAERVGKDLGIDTNEIYSNLMPLNKLEIIESIIQEQKGQVIFVGDGINDAPVIARADIGVAMGGAGSDITIEAADLVIMDDNPERLPEAINIAQRTNSIAKQNIIFAIGIKATFILLGVLGLASMWVAVFGDMGVTLLTILNSLRLLK